MRQALSANPTFLFKEGTLVGIELGYSHCAEHEWGIQGIKFSLGLDDSLRGIERRRIRRIPNAEGPGKILQMCDVGDKRGDRRGLFLRNDTERRASNGMPWFLANGAGLVFKIISRTSPEELQTYLDKDLESEKLKAAAKATGIEDLLRCLPI